MTLGRAATPEPFDLGAVAGSDELFEALSTRRLTEPGTGPGGPGGSDDPAVALLAALVRDVDTGAPPLSAHARTGRGMAGLRRRRSVRAVVTLGVAALVMTSAGAAVAGGGNGLESLRPPHGQVQLKGTERSNANTQRQVPAPGAVLTGRRTPATGHDKDRRPSAAPPQGELEDVQGERPSSRPGPRASRARSRIPTDISGKRPKVDDPEPPPPSTLPAPDDGDLPLP